MAYVDGPLVAVLHRQDLDTAFKCLLDYLAACDMRPARSKMWIVSTAGTCSPCMAYDRDGWFPVKVIGNKSIEHLGAKFPFLIPAHGLHSTRKVGELFEECSQHAQFHGSQAVAIWNKVILPSYIYMAIVSAEQALSRVA